MFLNIPSIYAEKSQILILSAKLDPIQSCQINIHVACVPLKWKTRLKYS